jgi:hypothetical protein
MEAGTLASTGRCWRHKPWKPEGVVSTNVAFVRSEVAARRQISSRRDSLCCARGRLARLMPAGERTKRLEAGIANHVWSLEEIVGLI